MKIDGKSMLLGAAATVLVLFAGGAILLAAGGSRPMEQRHRSMNVGPGRSLEVTAFHLAFGDDHSGRGAIDDALEVEYVTGAADDVAREKEAADVFERLRPLAESPGIERASLSAFPSLVRKGRYERRVFTRNANGRWTSQRSEAKVFVND